jgi:hypothetical protein
MEKETKENLGMFGFFGIFALIIILGSIFQNPSVFLIGFGWIGANVILYIIIWVIIIGAIIYLNYYYTHRVREP